MNIITAILILLLLLFFIFYKTHNENFQDKKKIYAIHSVFISKENILFLEEWIDYHIQLGFNRFYLYDNSKVNKKSNFDSTNKNLKLGKINKYNINYDEIVKLDQSQVDEIMDKIVEKYNKKIIIIEWSPKDKDGNVLYNQHEAHMHCLNILKKDKVDWCANIDMDEYIVINSGKSNNIQEYINKLDDNVSNLKMGQIRLSSRFNDINSLVINKNNVEKNKVDKYQSPKNIYKVKNTNNIYIHTWNGTGKEYHPEIDELCFNHYKIIEPSNTKINNINNKIKQNIERNSKNYIIKSYL